MISITDKSRCCGCSACFAACPKDAITMKQDPLGFRYPETDHAKCVDCGICEKVCAFGQKGNGTLPEAYAVRHKDFSVVRESTSGAVFTALSDKILENGGTVYGAAYDADFHVIHKRVEDKAGRDGLRKSKYVQSDMGDVFRQVRADLKDGRQVLFSGTPCQTAGLKSYIGPTLCGSLYLVDIVCHGVPSPKVWESYLEWMQEKEGDRLLGVNFRDKAYGWRSCVETFEFKGKKVASKSYAYMYYKHLALRESCSVCPYADVSRPSDITLADYWRKDKTCPEFASDNMGCSLVLCHTAKGREFLQSVSSSLMMVKTDLDRCIQPNMVRPSALHPQRKRFEHDFLTRGLEYVMKRYGDRGWRYRITSTLKAVYQFFRQTARKILGRR